MKSKVFFRSLALTALAFFLLSFAALAEPAPDPTPVPTPAPVNAAGASITFATYTLEPGERFDLSVKEYFPINMDERLEWRSSNPDVASVSDADGSKTTTVRAIKNGRATISLVGTRSLLVLAKCQVTVRTVKITSMAVSPKSLAIAPGQNYILRASIKPSNATFGSVTWTSPDPTIASFDQAGTLATATTTSDHSVRVYAQNPDKATKVTLTAVTDTGRRATCVVTVKALAVSSVKFPKSKLTVYLRDANLKPLTAAISPANTGFTIAYDSLNKDVAEIDPATGVLTLKTPGTATISASAGGKTGYCKLTVASVNIKTLSIKTPSDAAVVLDQGGTALLTAVASPAYAAVTGVTWESDNEAVATVADGLVTAGTTGGYARITARSVFNTKVKATVSVHVRGAGAYRTVTITAAGDAVLGGDQRKSSAAANPRSYYDFIAAITKPNDDGVAGDGKVFSNVKKYFEGENNITTLNLEGTLTLKDTRHDKKPFVFQGDPQWAQTMLKDNYIDTVCIANNHSYDVGKDGYEGTMRALTKKKIGFYGNGIVDYVTKNGVKVGFVGFISANSSPSGVMNQVRNAAKNSDMVVAAFHWTDVKEFRYQAPTNRQKSLAHAAISAGADLVLGHHVHRLNGIERYKGKYIVYDLGNFVTIAKNPLNAFLPDNPRGRFDYDSMIYQQKFNVWADGFVEPADITIIPCSITSSPKALVNNAQPMPYTDPEDIDRVKALIESRTNGFSDMPITFTH